MLLLSQKDPQWAKTKIGRSSVNVGAKGCTLTAVCIISSKFGNDPFLPERAAKEWVYTLDGRILWEGTSERFWKQKGFEFVWRSYVNNLNQIKEYANHPDKAVILRVGSPEHWVAVKEVNGTNIVICDPIDGKEYQSLPKKYKITGYTLFKRTSNVPNWAQEACKLAANIPLPTENLMEEMTIEDIQKDLEVLKKISSIGELPRFRWYEILRRLNLI